MSVNNNVNNVKNVNNVNNVNKCEDIFKRHLKKVAQASIGYNYQAHNFIQKYKERADDITHNLSEAMRDGDIFLTTKHAHEWEKMWLVAIENAKKTSQATDPKKILDQIVSKVNQYIPVESADIAMELNRQAIPKYFIQFNSNSTLFRIKL